MVHNGAMREIPDLVAELRAVLTALGEAKVAYALCGGLAANIYGADRFTKDIDLLVAPGDLDGALAAARSCGFNIDSGVMPLGDGKHRMHRVVKLEPGWEEPLPLDLMIADSGTYAAAYDSRQCLDHEDQQLWLVTRADLLEMKRESGRPIDQQDIERLS